jgi:hypothetical protein
MSVLAGDAFSVPCGKPSITGDHTIIAGAVALYITAVNLFWHQDPQSHRRQSFFTY